MNIIQQGTLYDQNRLRFSPLIIGIGVLLIIIGCLALRSLLGLILIGLGVTLLLYLLFLISNASVLKWSITEQKDLLLNISKKEYLITSPANLIYGYKKNHVKRLIDQYSLYVICKSDLLEEPLIFIEQLPAGKIAPGNWEPIREIPVSDKVYGNSNGIILKPVKLSLMIELMT